MDGDPVRRFRAQAEKQSRKEIEKAVKRLSKEEVDKFIEVMERYNTELHEQLVYTRYVVQQGLVNHEILARDVLSIVPEEIRVHLVRQFDDMNELVQRLS